MSSVSIPASVNTFGSGAYRGCANLRRFEVDPANEFLCAVDGVLYSRDTTTLAMYPAGRTSDTYRILPSVTTIAAEALADAEYLTTLIIPAGVNSIKDRAFGSYPKYKRIICYATTPPAIYQNTFTYYSRNMILSVPAESLELYRQDPAWKQIPTIEPIEE